MAEFTKEQLIEKLERRLAVTTHYPDFEEAQLDAQIFKIALEALTAGMEQEPVAWLLSRTGRLELVWWSFPIAEVMSFTLSTIFLRRTVKSANEVMNSSAD